MTSVTDYDNFVLEAVGAIAEGVGAITTGIADLVTGKAKAESETEIARQKAAAEIAGAFYGSVVAGEQRAAGVTQTNRDIIASFSAQQASRDEAKKASSQKWVWIAVSIAVMIGIGILMFFILNRKKKAAA